MKDYEKRIWSAAVSEAELSVMRITATAPGGRMAKESVEEYVERARKLQAEALAKLVQVLR